MTERKRADYRARTLQRAFDVPYTKALRFVRENELLVNEWTKQEWLEGIPVRSLRNRFAEFN